MVSTPNNNKYTETYDDLDVYDGDLDDITLDPEMFEDDGNYGLDNLHYATLEDELDPVSAAAEEPTELDFGEALTEDMDLEDRYDAKINADFNKAVAMFNPANFMESTFVIPESASKTNSLKEYVQLIEAEYNKFLTKKLNEYSF